MEEKLKEFEEKFSYAFIGDFANAEIQEIKDWIAENFTTKASQLEPPVSLQNAVREEIRFLIERYND